MKNYIQEVLKKNSTDQKASDTLHHQNITNDIQLMNKRIDKVLELLHSMKE